jgi:cholesterol transport system auxiliary component
MSALIRFAIMLTISAVLAACVSFGPQEPQRYYVLDAPAASSSATASSTPAVTRASTLLIAPTTVSSFYETQEIVYSRTPGTRAYYQLHAWTERPGQRMTELLVRRLNRAGSFRAVAIVGGGVRGDVVLATHLSEFYHDAASTPGSVKVSITSELMDRARRVVLARRTFVHTAPVATYDAPGAVLAFSSAMAVLLDEISAWVEAIVPR